MQEETYIVHTTVADEDEAKKIASLIIDRRLSACVHYYPVKSIYIWEGAVEHSTEYVIAIKTISSKLQELAKFIKEVHSYQVPEIIAYKLHPIEEQYQRWLIETIKGKE
ncbi:MAG: divalent-cation tolerance protein CutA [Candidatus Heimdallarchaeaceae archaeon]